MVAMAYYGDTPLSRENEFPSDRAFAISFLVGGSLTETPIADAIPAIGQSSRQVSTRPFRRA